MTLPRDADILWHTALALARRSGGVSPYDRNMPPLLFFTDPPRTPTPWCVAERMPQGAGVVYRAFSRPDAREVGQRLRAACDLAGLRLLVGKDEVLAREISADGIHLPENDMHRAKSLRAANPDWIITSALHGPLDRRSAHGLDAFVVSPVFPAGGSSGDKVELGVTGANVLIESLPCPAYALGGINAENAHRLLNTQACGIAGIDTIQAAFSG